MRGRRGNRASRGGALDRRRGQAARGSGKRSCSHCLRCCCLRSQRRRRRGAAAAPSTRTPKGAAQAAASRPRRCRGHRWHLWCPAAGCPPSDAASEGGGGAGARPALSHRAPQAVSGDGGCGGRGGRAARPGAAPPRPCGIGWWRWWCWRRRCWRRKQSARRSRSIHPAGWWRPGPQAAQGAAAPPSPNWPPRRGGRRGCLPQKSAGGL